MSPKPKSCHACIRRHLLLALSVSLVGAAFGCTDQEPAKKADRTVPRAVPEVLPAEPTAEQKKKSLEDIVAALRESGAPAKIVPYGLGPVLVTNKNGIARLADLTGIRTLSLGHPHVSDPGLRQIEGLSGLKELQLFDTCVTDAGLGSLGRMTALEKLCLH